MFSQLSPVWKGTPTRGKFSERVHAFNSAVPKHLKVELQTLRRWRDGFFGEKPRLMGKFCGGVNHLAGTSVVADDVTSDTVTFEAFAAKLGLSVRDARYMLAQEQMAVGTFMPSRMNLAPLVGADASDGPEVGLYVVERFMSHEGTADGRPESRCLLVIDRFLRRSEDDGSGTYVRFFVPASSADHNPQPVEYEGLMFSINGLAYVLLQCLSLRAKDMIFMIVGADTYPAHTYEGQYMSVYIDGTPRAQSRHIRIIRSPRLRAAAGEAMTDAMIDDELAHLFATEVSTQP